MTVGNLINGFLMLIFTLGKSKYFYCETFCDDWWKVLDGAN